MYYVDTLFDWNSAAQDDDVHVELLLGGLFIHKLIMYSTSLAYNYFCR